MVVVVVAVVIVAVVVLRHLEQIRLQASEYNFVSD